VRSRCTTRTQRRMAEPDRPRALTDDAAPRNPRTAWWVAATAVVPTVALLIAILRDWSGPAVVVVTLWVLFLAPGLACRVAFRQPLVNQADVAMTMAVSVAATILLGLWLDAVRVSLTRRHWAEALTAFVVIAVTVGLVTNPPWPARSRNDNPRFHARVIASVAAGCLVMTARGAGIVAWVSQQNWLSGQHFTELYTRSAADRERVFVHNHEGRSVGYRVLIQPAGAASSVVRFSLASDETWTDDVPVSPAAATPAHPLLRVLLFLGNDPTVYRHLRLP
jgi:hypothetical protein